MSDVWHKQIARYYMFYFDQLRISIVCSELE